MFIPLHQCMGTIRSKFVYQVSISQIAPDYFFRKIEVSRGAYSLDFRLTIKLGMPRLVRVKMRMRCRRKK